MSYVNAEQPRYHSQEDAEFAFSVSDSLLSADINCFGEIIDCMYQNNLTLEQVLSENPQWSNAE